MWTCSCLLALLLAGAAAAVEPALKWLPGRLSLRFLEAPVIAEEGGRLDLGPAFRELLAGLPEARLAPLCPLLRVPTVPDLALCYVLTVDPARDIPALAAAFAATGQVEYAEPDWLLPLRRTPNDPLAGSQWSLGRVEAFAAWDLLPEPLPQPPVVIALIDAGLRWTHADLRAAMWINPGEDLDGDGAMPTGEVPGESDERNGVDDDGNGKIDDFYGWDWIDNIAGCMPGEDCDVEDNNPGDFSGHGTGCAGVAAASTDNGLGLASLAWDARLMGLRAGYTDGDGAGVILSSAAANAVAYAMENGARIISMSFAGSNTLRVAATAAWNAGLLCFHATGEVPDQLDNALGIVRVAATDSLDCAAGCGDWIDLLAPGVDLLTTGLVDYTTASGSSLACPQAAGLAALVWRLAPQLDNAGLREHLQATVDAVDGLPCNLGCVSTAGRINARRALESLSGVAVPAGRPGRVTLRCSPNPFNPLGRVLFSLPVAAQARLTAHDLMGRRVALLMEGRLGAGEHEARFDGAGLPSGLYLLRLELDGVSAGQGKALLLR